MPRHLQAPITVSWILWVGGAAALAQQPYTPNALDSPAVNATWTQGVGPGYWPTAGSGHTLNLTAGTAFCDNSTQQQRIAPTYAGGTLTLTASSTNYVYLSPVGPAPPSASATPASSGGSLATGTYRVLVTYTNPSGETLPNFVSGEASVSVTGPNGKITVTSPAANLNAAGYNVYVTAVNGGSLTETKQNTSVIALGTNYSVTSITTGAGFPQTDTSGCAPWFNTTGFGAGQHPIAIVTTNGSAIVPPIIDVRNWFNLAGPADAGSQVFNVMAYGAMGDGATDDTAAIQATIVVAENWAGGIVYFPPGTYVLKSGLVLQTGALEFRGAGIQSVLEIEHSADAITIPASSSGFKMEDLQIQVNYSSGSRGTNAVIASSAGNGFVRNIIVQSVTTANAGVFYRCTTAGADGWLFDTVLFVGGASVTWQDYFLLQNSSSSQTLASYFWTNIVGGTGLADAGWDLNGALDTMWFIQCDVSVPSGATSAPVIWVQNTVSSSTEFPRWVECVHCGIEAPGQTGLKIDTGKNVEYSGYIAGSTTGVAVGGSAIETNVHDTVFVNIGHSAITYTGTGGLQVHDNQFDSTGQQPSNTYDTISITGTAGNFQIMNNYWRNSTYFAAGIPRYGVNVGTGVTNYSISGNQYTGATFGTSFLYDLSNAGTTIVNSSLSIPASAQTNDTTLTLQTQGAVGGSGGQAVVSFNDNATLSFKVGAALGNTSGHRYGGLLAYADRDGTKLPIEFWTTDTGGTLQNALYISAGQTSGTPGNVGIGTTSPALQLQVHKAMAAHLYDLGTLTSGTAAFDASQGNTQKVTLGYSSVPSSLTGAVAGEAIDFIICQDGTGGRTFSWPSNVQAPPPVDMAAGACTYHSTIFDGTNAVPLNRDSSGNLTGTGIAANGSNQSITLTPSGTGTLNVATKLGSYNSISTVDNGLPSEYAHVDLTGQSASIGATTAYAVPSSGAGMYRVCYVAFVTTTATTSSSIAVNIISNNGSGSFTASGTVYTGNTLGGETQGCVGVYSAASQTIQYSTTYSSTGGTAMVYALHIKVEAL